MKIQVVRCDGQIETLNLTGTLRAEEASAGGQGSLLIDSTKTTHFFRLDGAYDGWGMDIADQDGALDERQAIALIEAVERDREIHRPGKLA